MCFFFFSGFPVGRSGGATPGHTRANALVKKPLPWSMPCLKFGIINFQFSRTILLQNNLIVSMKRSRTSKSKVQFHSDKNSLTALQCLLIGTLHRLYIYVSSRKLRHSIAVKYKDNGNHFRNPMVGAAVS
jgi:hypothetical protein